MAVMHRFSYKQILGLVIVGLLSFGGVMQQKNSKKEPETSISTLDAVLLSDLKHQFIDVDDNAACIMACANLKMEDLKVLFDYKNLDANKQCEGNCHFTSYPITGEISSGEKVSFNLEAGEDGNIITALNISNTPCDCSR